MPCLRVARWGLPFLVSACLVLGVPARGDDSPAGSGSGPDPLAAFDARIRDDDRAHWSFQPVRRPEISEVRDRAWVQNPIDAFVLAKLEEQGWSPAPPAARPALLRRLHFDLTGLPPTPEEVEAFENDPSPTALPRRIDDLLARPSHGERWARHWLDVVRFAETNGYERDAVKPHAWRYRDYVIRAFNDDKPFDRFLIEQLAGDELPDRSAETMIATGFLRVGPWDDEPADPKQDRFDQLDDIVRTTSEVFMGLTLGCARCHDHKYEPFTQADYYRMVAVFDPLRRPQNGRTELDLPAGSPDELAREQQRDRLIAAARRVLDALREEARALHLASGNSRLPAEAIEALKLNPFQRNEEQKALAERHAKELEAEIAAGLPLPIRQAMDGQEQIIAELRRQTPDLPRGYFWSEPSASPPPTHVLLRGQAAAPGPVAAPGWPAVLTASQPVFPAPERTTLRRLTLARWLARPDHPLTARVIVNRVWQHHFGEGLVRTTSEFGTMGEEPTHPELLDWLASWFVEHGWSLKALHRLILSSSTYQMSTRAVTPHDDEDPEDRLLWRRPYRRLEAEAIRDAMLAVSGRLDPMMYGPSVYPEIPRAALESHSDPDRVWMPFDERAASRRTVYAMIKRSLVVPMLEVLDFCDTTQSASRRSVTSVATQALTLLNGEFVNRQARHFADRLRREAGPDPDAQIRRACLLALGRPPSPREHEVLRAYLTSGEGGQTPRLTRMCRAIFNLNEFVYPD
jgi:hypothetical protein